MSGAIEPATPGTTLMRIDQGEEVKPPPKEAGLFLILIGVGGIMLPGPIGTPFLVLGVLVFFPRFFRKLDQGIERRFPASHLRGMKQVHRFVDDLERRYPSGV